MSRLFQASTMKKCLVGVKYGTVMQWQIEAVLVLLSPHCHFVTAFLHVCYCKQCWSSLLLVIKHTSFRWKDVCQRNMLGISKMPLHSFSVSFIRMLKELYFFLFFFYLFVFNLTTKVALMSKTENVSVLVVCYPTTDQYRKQCTLIGNMQIRGLQMQPRVSLLRRQEK